MTKIKVVVDNIADEPFHSEHGYSVYIEHKGKKVLFDTAQGEAFIHNSKELGLEFKELDYLVLSHGHYDHGGNIAKVMNENRELTFVAHPNCTVPRYSLHEGKPVKSTALTQENKKAIIEKHHSEIRWSFGATEVCEDIWVTGEIPRVSSFEDTGGPFYLDQKKETPDLIPDDMALFIDTGEKLSVICGCCHSGLINTLEYIKSINSKPVHTLIGGLHLLYANEERLTKTIEYLNSSDIKIVYPSHCTGVAVMPLLKDRLKADVIFGRVGLEI